jgi:hypothetical protein
MMKRRKQTSKPKNSAILCDPLSSHVNTGIFLLQIKLRLQAFKEGLHRTTYKTMEFHPQSLFVILMNKILPS